MGSMFDPYCATVTAQGSTVTPPTDTAGAACLESATSPPNAGLKPAALEAAIGGALVSLAFAAQVVGVLGKFPMGDKAFPTMKLPPGETLNDIQKVGESLFSQHVLPLQIVGVLILVATIGVIVISKRELK